MRCGRWVDIEAYQRTVSALKSGDGQVTRTKGGKGTYRPSLRQDHDARWIRRVVMTGKRDRAMKKLELGSRSTQRQSEFCS